MQVSNEFDHDYQLQSPETSEDPTPRRLRPRTGSRRRTRSSTVPIDDEARPQPRTRQGGLRCHRRHRPRVPGLGVRQHGDAGQRIRVRTGLDHGQHRLVVRADRVRVRGLRAVAGARQVRQHPARLRRRGTRVPDHVLDGDDVQRGHGHRPDVLRCRRAARRTSLRRRRAPVRRGQRRMRCRPRWPPRCSTGRCTRGRSTRSSGWPSPTASTARAGCS